MLAKGLSALLFQIVSGSLLDAYSGNTGYTIIYSIFAGFMILSFILSCKFRIDKKPRGI